MGKFLLEKSLDPNTGLASLTETSTNLLVAQESISGAAAQASDYLRNQNKAINIENQNKVSNNFR